MTLAKGQSEWKSLELAQYLTAISREIARSYYVRLSTDSCARGNMPKLHSYPYER